MGKWTRRGLITAGVIGGGGLVIGVGLGIAVRPGYRVPTLEPLVTKDGETLINAWVKILPDNSTTVIVPHCEMGQGVHTSLPMMLADEMDADWNTVSMEMPPAHDEYASIHAVKDLLFSNPSVPGYVVDSLDGAALKVAQLLGFQLTGGSLSVRATGTLGMRVAGAAAREMLINAAATQWNVSSSELRAQNSVIYHDKSSRSGLFIEFAEAAGSQQPPAQPKLKRPEEFRLMGTSIARLDIPAKVDGSAQFGIDIELPNMKYATVKAAPVFGDAVVSIDSSVAQKIPGVLKIVDLGDSVGVIADSYWRAKNALAAVEVIFTDDAAKKLSQTEIFDQFGSDMDAAITDGNEQSDFKIGDARAVLGSSSKVLNAEYKVPYLAHATMEPMNCTAWVHDGKIELWAGMQNPLGVKNDIAAEYDLDKSAVIAHNAYLGGGFGRRTTTDYPLQAVKLASAIPGVPVKMIWSREEDMQHDVYRPAVVSRFQGALDSSGLPIAWENQFVDKRDPVEAPYIPYAIENQFIHFADSPTHVPFGPWRSVDHSQHGFFTESFIDEMAFAAQQDPYEYRRRLLSHEPRLQHVLNTAATLADWGTPLPYAWGRGIALQSSFGTLVAQVVTVDMSKGSPRVESVHSAVDAGYAVNPDGLVAQIESGVIFGLTAALYGEISLEKGAVKQSNFHDYKMVRMNDAPRLHVEVINSGEAIGGGGEPGTPAVAPALVNAIFAATGSRIRELPVSKFDNTYDIKSAG